MDASKQICLDEVSLRLLHSLKSERARKCLSQKELGDMLGVNRVVISHYESGRSLPSLCHLIKLSEIFGYDLSTSVNYKYWHGQIDWWKLRKQLTYHGFTCTELSGYIGYGISTVCLVFQGDPKCSLGCLNAILETFENERNMLKFRKELLSRKTPARREWWKRTKAPAMPNSGSREIWQWPY